MAMSEVNLIRTQLLTSSNTTMGLCHQRRRDMEGLQTDLEQTHLRVAGLCARRRSQGESRLVPSGKIVRSMVPAKSKSDGN